MYHKHLKTVIKEGHGTPLNSFRAWMQLVPAEWPIKKDFDQKSAAQRGWMNGWQAGQAVLKQDIKKEAEKLKEEKPRRDPQNAFELWCSENKIRDGADLYHIVVVRDAWMEAWKQAPEESAELEWMAKEVERIQGVIGTLRAELDAERESHIAERDDLRAKHAVLVEKLAGAMKDKEESKKAIDRFDQLCVNYIGQRETAIQETAEQREIANLLGEQLDATRKACSEALRERFNAQEPAEQQTRLLRRADEQIAALERERDEATYERDCLRCQLAEANLRRDPSGTEEKLSEVDLEAVDQCLWVVRRIHDNQTLPVSRIKACVDADVGLLEIKVMLLKQCI